MGLSKLPGLLSYVSAGTRKFGMKPFPISKRSEWEFYAVIRGRIAPSGIDNKGNQLKSQRMWIFPPGSIHGWVGDKKQAAQVVVFHFQSIPLEVERRIRKIPDHSIALTTADCSQLAHLAKRTLPYFWKEDQLLKYYAQLVLMELSVLIFEKNQGSKKRMATALERVKAAELWYAAQLSRQPTIDNLAWLIGTTVGNLGRLFQQVRHCSTKKALQAIQMKKAAQLLHESSSKLEVVAEECGFTQSSSFCTTFKRCFGVTPSEYRLSVIKTGGKVRSPL